MPKTAIEKSPSSSPDVAVFSISGTLGFHEKDTLEKLFSECKKRDITNVALNLSELTSLGGGCAKILRAVAASGEMSVGIAGAKLTVLKFLKDEGELVIADTVEEVVSVLTGNGPTARPGAEQSEIPGSRANAAAATAAAPEEDPLPEEAVVSEKDAVPKTDAVQPEESAHRENETPRGDVSPAEDTVPKQEEKRPDPVPAAESESDMDLADEAVDPAPEPPEDIDNSDVNPRTLKKRIIQYNTLFSLNSDFYRVHDRGSLLDLFLLTTIAQVGVESAVFLEYRENYFTPAAVKGLEADELRGFALDAKQLNLDSWINTLDIYTIENAPFTDEVKAPLLSLGCSYVVPFIVHNAFRGIVTLGKPIKSELDEGTIDILKILVNQAAIAYESMQLFEEEKERTLGLVQTLIALIEENTLARGNTNLLSSYLYELAKKSEYPKEHIRDLMYGAVLRDIGMIKVSDLIVRSPRELMPEEWEIIKRHPIDGADMLEKMKFSEQAVDVVRAHHERFNGEGYPNGLQGKQIPMGARIVSIVESYAAMLQERPTRPALTQEEALNTLKENWGLRYDPEIVEVFVEIVEEEIRTGECVRDSQSVLFSV